MIEQNLEQIAYSLREIAQALAAPKEMVDYIKEYVGLVLQVVSTFLAAWLVIWQVGKQHRNDIRLQRGNLKEEIKRKLHEEIEMELDKLTTASVNVTVWNRLNMSFVVQQAQIAQGVSPMPISLKIEEVIKANADLGSCIARTICTIEKYEIVEPNIKIFQTALNARAFDLNKAWVELSSFLFQVLPQNSPDGKTILYKPIANDQVINKIKSLAEPYDKAAFDIGSVVYDFRVEIQNLLLGNLFDHTVQKRKPIDPNEVVISTDAETFSKLSRYFEEETPWGKDKQKIEEDVKRSFQKNP